METKDTLELYDNLIAGGCSESQARVQATQLGAMGTALSNSIDSVFGQLRRIDSKLDKMDKDMFWMRAIGAGMIVSFLATAFRH